MRIFLSLLLAAGAVVGIGGGVARLHHGGPHHRRHMMERVAETCVEAARNLDRREGHAAHAPPPVFVPYPYAPPPQGYAPHALQGARGHHDPERRGESCDHAAPNAAQQPPTPAE